MRSILMVAVSLLLSITVVQKDLIAQETMGDEAKDEKAIRAVVARYAEAWNANDMTAWRELFTDDVDYVHRGGGWWKSNEENVEGHRRIHERLVEQNQEMNLELTVAGVSFLSSEIALVHVTSEWPGFGAPEDEDGDLGGIMTMVMVQKGGAWRIRALQNTLVSHPAP